MKILMLLGNEYPTDNRVEKEIESLVNDGHIVHLACITRKGNLPLEQINGFVVHRKAISKLMFKLGAAILILPFYNLFWKRFVNQLFKHEKYEAVHVHDLPLSKIGYYCKMKFGTLFVCDQHEYYSNWIVHTDFYNKGLGLLIKYLSNWKTYERKYLNRAELVITIEEPLRENYIKNVGVSPHKVILVPNTPTLEVFENGNVNQDIVKSFEHDWMIFYAGGIDRLRGLELVINALKSIKKSIPNVKFVIAGKVAKGFDLNKTISLAGAEDCVHYLGWINHDLIPSFIAASKVGVFTPPGNREEIHNTIATKIYQYAAMETPMIVSNIRLMKKFVEQHGIGMAVDDSEMFVQSIVRLHTDAELYEQMCKNCIYVRENFVWNNTIKPLLAFYKK